MPTGLHEPPLQTESKDVRTIDIIGVDRMKYVVKEAGEKLRIRLTTVSKLPASAMSHNWILLKMGIDPAGFAQATTQAKSNDYIPQDRTDDIIAHTELAAGGETVEVTFTVPEKTGNYDYLCSFPAHFMAGMKGKLMVQ